MSNGTDDTEESTRRDFVAYGGAVVGGGLLAGCTGSSDPDGGDSGDAEGTETETPADEETTTDEVTETEETAAGERTETGEPTAYEACIEPVGCLTFEEAPETYAVYNGAWADEAFALGQQGPRGTAHTARTRRRRRYP